MKRTSANLGYAAAEIRSWGADSTNEQEDCDLLADVADHLDQKWVIWSNEHDAWWAPNNRGYTTLFERAGLYTYDQAVHICAGANWGCSGDGDTDSSGPARSGQGRPMETMLPAVGCYGKKNNARHPESA